MQSIRGASDTAAIRSRWGWFAIYGVLLLIVGIIALANAVSATLVTTLFVGYLLVIGGIIELATAFVGPRSIPARLLHIIVGVIYILAGLYLIANPVLGAITIAIVIAAMLIIDGLVRIWFGLGEGGPDRWLFVAFGVVDVLLGLWLWTGIPLSALAIGFYVGIAFIFAGVSWLTLALRARSA